MYFCFCKVDGEGELRADCVEKGEHGLDGGKVGAKEDNVISIQEKGKDGCVVIPVTRVEVEWDNDFVVDNIPNADASMGEAVNKCTYGCVNVHVE